MSTLFLSLFLIIFVLFFVTLRIFVPNIYTRYQKYDSLAVLPIIILIISILLLNAFGLTHSILIAIALSLVIFLSNLRNFYNLCIGLDRDDYHPLFKVVSLIQNILLLIFLIILIIYFPTILKTQKSLLQRQLRKYALKRPLAVRQAPRLEPFLKCLSYRLKVAKFFRQNR